jgi:hypothetical protein
VGYNGHVSRPRELVRVVLAEAALSSLTPFVPVPFVDDWILEKLLTRIARKVAPHVAPSVVRGYLTAGAAPLTARALSVAAHFVVRKIALVFDVKRSHDVFGEAIGFAYGLDVAPHSVDAAELGSAIHRSLRSLGPAALEVLTRAARSDAPFGDAVGRELDLLHERLGHLLRYETRTQ